MTSRRSTPATVELDESLTTEDVAALCHTSPGTVHYWRTQGKGPKAYRVGRRLIFRRSDVEEWLERYASDPADRAASARTRNVGRR